MVSVAQIILILFGSHPKNYGKWDSEKYAFISQIHATWKFILELICRIMIAKLAKSIEVLGTLPSSVPNCKGRKGEEVRVNSILGQVSPPDSIY